MKKVLKNLKTNYNINNLELCTLIYLAVPLILFFVSWFKWFYSVPLILGILVSIYSYKIKLTGFDIKKNSINYFICIFFLLLIGYGEVITQSGDWFKHNAIFSEIFEQWNKPVIIEFKGQNYILCYGLGFYMVPSWIAGLFDSYFLLRWLVLLNSAFGLFLIFKWIKKIWNLSIWYVIAIFFIDRLDFLADLRWLLIEYDNFSEIWWHLVNFNSFDIIDQIPQHSLSIILVSLSIIYHLKNDCINQLYIFQLFTFGIFWSPFFVFALLPFVLIVLFRIFKENKWIFSFHYISIFIVLFFILYYYSLHFKVDTFSIKWKNLRHFVYIMLFRFIPTYIVPIVFIYILNFKINKLKITDYTIILIMIIFSIIYTHINYGFFNDFTDKTTLIVTFVLNIYLIYLIKHNYYQKRNIVLIFLIVISGIFMPFKMIASKYYVFSNEKLIKEHFYYTQLLKSNKSITLKNAMDIGYKIFKYPFIYQYLGMRDNNFNSIFKNCNKKNNKF